MWKFLDAFRGKVAENERLNRLENDVRSVKVGVEDLERAFKGIELDWEEAYDKLKHLMARITKRQAALNAENGVDETSPPPTNNSPAIHPNANAGVHETLRSMRARNGLLPR